MASTVRGRTWFSRGYPLRPGRLATPNAEIRAMDNVVLGVLL
jgi:hypothetical protein